MPTTPTASPAVSSTIGLKNVVIASLTEDSEQTLTYGALQLVAGAMEASVTPDNAEPDIQYADDIEFDTLYPDPQLSFRTKMADIPLTIQEMIFGNRIDENGVLIRTATDKPPYFAVGFKSEKSKDNILKAFQLEPSALDDYLTDVSFFTYDLKIEPRWRVDFRLSPVETASYSVLITRQGEATADEQMGIRLPEDEATRLGTDAPNEIVLLEQEKGPREIWSLGDKAKYLGPDNGLPVPGDISQEEAVAIAAKALEDAGVQDLDAFTLSVWFKQYDEYADSASPKSPFYLVSFIDQVEAPYNVYSVLLDPKTGNIIKIYTPDSEGNEG